MSSDLLNYEIGGASFDMEVASPKGPGPFPVVMVFHAWGGRDAFISEKLEKLAALGYIGAGVDLYGVGKRGSDIESSAALMTPLVENPDILEKRIAAAFEQAQGISGADSSKVAAIGYCFGGLCVTTAARQGLPLKGVVSFHGLLNIPKIYDGDVTAKILLLHGQDDPMAGPDDIRNFAAEMKKMNAEWTLEAYPKTMHAFTNPVASDPDFGTVYNEEADKKSWNSMERFLREVFT